MMVYGGGANPFRLKFDCSRCKPDIKVTLVEVHPEHLRRKLVIHKPMKVDGKIVWYTRRRSTRRRPPSGAGDQGVSTVVGRQGAI
ncbi:hypothetical protein [Mesorhizobium sp.]|nr:hypothetical protein [Mesorhizobium sp.]